MEFQSVFAVGSRVPPHTYFAPLTISSIRLRM
jgi:hypothetical protein